MIKAITDLESGDRATKELGIVKENLSLKDRQIHHLDSIRQVNEKKETSFLGTIDQHKVKDSTNSSAISSLSEDLRKSNNQKNLYKGGLAITWLAILAKAFFFR